MVRRRRPGLVSRGTSMACLVCAVVACDPGLEPGEAVTEIPVLAAAGPMPILRWRLCGPLDLERGGSPGLSEARVHLHRNRAAVEEGTIRTGMDFRKLCATGIRTHWAPDQDIDLGGVWPARANTYAYASAELVSPQGQTVIMSGSADDAIVLWLNGELQQVHFAHPGSKRGGDRLSRSFAFSARLKAGPNFLLVKSFQRLGGWGFNLSLSATTFHQSAAGRGDDRFHALERRVVPAGTALRLRVPAGYLVGDKGPISATIEMGGRTASTSAVGIDTRALPTPADHAGLATVTLVGSGGQWRERFFSGTAATMAALLERARQALRHSEASPGDRSTLAHLEARLAGLNPLLEQIGSQPLFPEDERELLLVAESLEDMAERASSGNRGLAGFRLRARRSAVDGGLEPYALFLPPLPAAGSVDLVLILPPVGHGLEAAPTAFFRGASPEARRHAELASQRGWAVAPRARNARGRPIGTRDVHEMLDDVRAHFPVNTQRVFVAGNARGGTDAMLFASRFPQRVRAVAALSPRLDLNETCEADARGLEWLRWYEVNSPVFYHHTVAPTMVVVGANERARARDLSRLQKQRAEAGSLLQVLTVPGSGEHRLARDPLPNIYEFFSRHANHRPSPDSWTLESADRDEGIARGLHIDRWVRPYSLGRLSLRRDGQVVRLQAEGVRAATIEPAQLGLQPGMTLEVGGRQIARISSTRDRVRVVLRDGALIADPERRSPLRTTRSAGPVLEVLARPFVVVRPSNQPDPAQRAALDAYLARLAETWQQRFFTAIPVVDEADLAWNERRNLLLIGSHYSSARLRKILAGMPMSVSRTRLTLHDASFTGQRLSIIAALPAPGEGIDVAGLPRRI